MHGIRGSALSELDDAGAIKLTEQRVPHRATFPAEFSGGYGLARVEANVAFVLEPHDG
jgi:hypothetical protein